MIKKCLILLLLLLTISITSCETVPTTVRYYDIIPPPTRPTLVQVMDDPIKGLTHNMSLLMTYAQRWELYLENMKAYDSL
jgi:hypothetical protein